MIDPAEAVPLSFPPPGPMSEAVPALPVGPASPSYRRIDRILVGEAVSVIALVFLSYRRIDRIWAGVAALGIAPVTRPRSHRIWPAAVGLEIVRAICPRIDRV